MRRCILSMLLDMKTRKTSKEPPVAEKSKDLQQALQQSQERLQSLIELSSDVFWEQDENHRFTLYQHKNLNNSGIDVQSILGKAPWELGGEPVGGKDEWDMHRAVREARQPFSNFIHKYPDPTSKYGMRYINISGQPVFDDQGQFRGYRGVAKDISKEIRAERLTKLENTVTHILVEAENIPDALTAAVRAICESEGWDSGQYWSLDETQGVMRYDQGWSIDDEAVREITLQAHDVSFKKGVGLVGWVWQTGEPLWVEDVDKESRILRKGIGKKTGWKNAILFPVTSQGKTIGVLDFSSKRIPEPDEHLLQVIHILGAEIGNFYQRTIALEKLRESEELYSDTFELSAIGIAHVGQNGKFILVNERMCEMFGYSREEFSKLSFRKFSHPDDVNVMDEGRIKLWAGEIDILKGDKRYLHKDGSVIWTSLTSSVKRDKAGKPLYAISLVEDITARKQAEAATLRLGRMFSALSETNEAILRSKSPEELYQRACSAAVSGGKFTLAAVLVSRGMNQAQVAAITGTSKKLPWIEVNFDADDSHERNLIDAAFNSQKTCVNNDFLDDELNVLFHEDVHELGIAAGAAIPLMRHGNCIGVLFFCLDETGAFDEEIIKLLENMAENITFALDNFHHEAERKQAEERLRESEERYHSTFDLAAIGIVNINPDGRLIHVNEQLCDMLGYAREELLGMTARQLSHPDDVDIRVTDEIRAKLLSGELKSFNMEKRYLRKDRTPIWVRISVAVKRDSDGKRLYDISVVEDITARKQAEDRLRESEERFHSTYELAGIGISHVDADGRFIHANRQLCEMLGYTREELLGLTVKQISHPDDVSVTDVERARLHAGETDSFKLEKRYLHKSGRPIWVGLTITVKRDEDGKPQYDISIVEDISARKEAEDRVQYLATHDEMTGLPNRAMFSQLLNHAIKSAHRYEHKFAILFIDLDRFKLINDSLGHAAGDSLLKEMSSRLSACLRASDVVARLGGDEFVVLVQGVNTPSQVATVARNILSVAIKPLEIMGQECRVTASIGICMFPDDANDEQSLMKNADMAMYLAKEEGKNNYQFYSKDIRSLSVERLALESNLRRALEQNELSLHYQAKVNIRTGEIKGVEALLRWQSPKLGSITPAQFIPLAEEMGLIVEIGKWVLRTACMQNVIWQQQGLPPVCMAVNLSPRQFLDQNLLGDIAEVLKETGMAPELLELEITESMVMHNIEQAAKKLRAIKELGVRIAIDDFGTGYSSLAQLKLFPIDTLKVDRSFIREIPKDTEDKAITEAIISMGKTLGLTVVAEGVETAEQQTFLSAHACDEMQGFYFSKPAVPEEFAALLKKHKPEPRS